MHIETSSSCDLFNPVLVYQGQKTMRICKSTQITIVVRVAGVRFLRVLIRARERIGGPLILARGSPMSCKAKLVADAQDVL